MKGRLGLFEEQINLPQGETSLTTQAAQFAQHGGYHQQERMIKDKRRSLEKALYYSYQGATVRLLNSDSSLPVRALIKPNKLKQDYDDKIISIGFEHNFKTGDVFNWCNTGTYWLIYLQDLTELAYFRGDIRKCQHQIIWEDTEGNKHSTYAAVRGPVETKIKSIQKYGISLDIPNYSLNILIPKNDETISYFKRYTKFYLDGTCWRIEAVDCISMENIIEFTAVEYYANETEDDIEEGIVGGLIEEVQDPNLTNDIQGETFIKPKLEYIYSVKDLEGDWIIDDNLPLKWRINDNNTLTLYWNANYSGQFEIHYGEYSKTIVVESLF